MALYYYLVEYVGKLEYIYIWGADLDLVRKYVDLVRKYVEGVRYKS